MDVEEWSGLAGGGGRQGREISTGCGCATLPLKFRRKIAFDA